MDSKKLSEIKRKREEEDEKVQEIRKIVRKDEYGKKEREDLSSEKVKTEIENSEQLIHQIDALYRQFMAGVESKPPHELQKKLHDKIATLTSAAKNSVSLRFRFNGLQSKLITYQDRWDRLLKDLETGKKRRLTLKK